MRGVDDDFIRECIALGEGPKIEFKDERIRPADLAETLVAFANADGGTVLMGVADDGAVVGVEHAKDAIDCAYIAASRDCCDPPVTLSSVELVAHRSGMPVLVVRVPRARTTTHSTQ